MTTNNSYYTNKEADKITAEKINGYKALFGCITLIGAYAATGETIPGFV